jgi:hypothetical protein
MLVGEHQQASKRVSMSNQLPIMLAAALALSVGVVSAPATGEAAKQTYQKVPASGGKLKNVAGYVSYCYYTDYGVSCEYVYAPVRKSKDGPVKMQRIKAANGPIKKKLGYYTQCYYSALGEVCETVYMRPKKP